MFLQAGFNPREFRRGRALFWVLIVPLKVWKPQRWAQVWRLQSGDIVFLTKTFAVWPHTCRIINTIGRGIYVPDYLTEYASPYPRRTQ